MQCLSVCPSVTYVHCIESSNYILKLFFTTILVFAVLNMVDPYLGHQMRFSTNIMHYLGNDKAWAIVTMERQQNIIRNLTNGTISNDLE